MNWTPETLARAFHEAYGRVSPKFFGTTGNAPDWDSISEKSRNHLTTVCADVLGEPLPIVTGRAAMEAERLRQQADAPMNLEPVPERAEFEKASESAPQEQDGLSDWEADLKQQITEAASKVRSVRKPFDGRVR